ncbi:MAG TPA: ABC-type transport auxiliary lipoprotein family protein [Steroidobacteraceae bacterium]|nr:ABC-type transport auxiliary lipoprotein family protein [Steroidobacteraceae bacterium]
MKLRAWPFLSLSLLLTACSGVFESDLAAPQAYVLRLPAAAAPEPNTSGGTLLVQRPDAGPGLASERIALLRSEHRFDFYAASRWAAPAPDVIESVMIDTLRATGVFSAVFDDTAPYAPRYNLRCTLRRFEADYTSEGVGKGGGAPAVFVALDCTLGRHRDRALLASFTASGSAAARDDRLSAVVAAFESATAAAMNELGRAASAALASEKPPSEGR